jgi:UrcA family protein
MFRSVLALVFLGFIGISGAAYAQEQAYRIPISDLDLSSNKDKARFDQRVEAVARKMCESYGVGAGVDRNHQACMRAVREEANENLRNALRQNTAQMAVQTDGR